MALYEHVFDNNRQWVDKQLARDPDYFSRMAEGQSPEILYIGCSDSRVQPEDFMGVQPGQVFVHRNIANLLPNNDLSAMSVAQYAVEHLRVRDIVVCGHYGCGGIKAALDNKDLGSLNQWVRNIDDVYRLHRDELNAITDSTARFRRLVELNVEEQCLNVLKYSFVQKRMKAGDDLFIHGWVYDIATGTVNDIEFDCDAYRQDLALYQLN
jgi:carbonic anhydrase